MNSQQAKKIDFPDLLQRLGYMPVERTKGGRELWYTSPFRKEKEPSFHTSFLGGKWVWKDFGDLEKKGNVIDFVMKYKGVQFKEALNFLRNIYQRNLFKKEEQGSNVNSFNQFSFQQHGNTDYASNEKVQRELEFIDAGNIQNPVIISYLRNQRKIPIDLARLYLKEVTYLNKPKNKTFFAFGMQNESGGYEIRAASDQYKFKSALIKRDITFVKGRGQQNKAINAFEGMTDFLSLLVFRKTKQLEEDSIIMHSVSTYKRAISFIRENAYAQLYTFLDNDITGAKCTTQLQNHLSGNCNIYPQNKAYHPYQDLNKMLIKSPHNRTILVTPVFDR